MGSIVKNILLIGVTLLIGFVLQIFPLPLWLIWYRPAWVLLILMFWLIALPSRVGVLVALVVGLLLDLLQGTLLGQHALVFTVIAYYLLHFHSQIGGFRVWEQLLLVAVTTAFYVGVQIWVMALAGMPHEVWRYSGIVVITILFWPWVRFLLEDFQHRFKLI